MTYRRVILAVLGIVDVVARLALGLPGAFPILMLVAIIALPLAAAFLAADCIPMRRDHAIASGVALVGLPMALLVPVWGWIAALVVVAAQAVAWATGRQRGAA